MRRECCVILTSHILCWGNEKQMGNMLPNMAQAWLWEKQERISFQFEKPTEPLLPTLGLWLTSFHDLRPKPRDGSLAHILPLMHKGSNWNKIECPSPPIWDATLSTAKPSLPWLPCGMEIVQKSPKGPMKDTKVVYSAAGKLSRRLPKWGASGQTTWIENQMGNHHTWKKYIAPESWQGKLTRQETEGLKYSSHRCSQKVPVTRYTGKSFLRRWRRSKEQHGTGAHILVPARPIPQQHGKQTQVPTGHVEAKTGREHWNT